MLSSEHPEGVQDITLADPARSHEAVSENS